MVVLKRFRWQLLAALLLLVAGYFVVALVMVRGATSAERRPFVEHPADHGLTFEDVEFPSRGDESLILRGWYLRGDEGAPHVVFVHGLDGQRTDANALAVAAGLLEGGYNVLVFDLRGHGESDGERVSGGYFERQDVLGAFDFLRANGADRIGLLGFSMGGGIAILTAAMEPEIEAVVADSPFASANDLIVQEAALRTPMPEAVVPVFMPGARLIARVFYDIDLAELTPEDAVRELTYPVLVIHGEGDARIPVSHGHRVLANAPEGSEIWTLPEVAHVSMSRAALQEYTERIIAYFDSRLR